MNIKKDRFRSYVLSGSRAIAGWLSRTDAEIISSILSFQTSSNLNGGVAEIGVHHGRLFVALCLAMKCDERAYCIDIFEDQNLNKDQSGHGDREVLEQNLRTFEIDETQVTVDERSSELVQPADITSKVGSVRFFSVDGGHWLEIVENDLRLAERALAPFGVIAVDDFLRAEWPEVSAAYFKWYATREKDIVPFAIGFNKLYLCERAYAHRYQDAIGKNEFLTRLQTKVSTFQGIVVPVYTEFPLPEFSLKERAASYLRIFHPHIFAAAKTLLRRGDRVKKVQA